MKRNGFTLVEIMIVVAIIAIVLAVSVPALVKMRQRADQKVCISNLRTISVAKKMWYIDNTTGNPDWTDLIPAYIKHTTACPIAGTYTIGDLNTEPSCTVTGHNL